MGEFSAGRWIVGLSIYFFLVFIIVFSAIGMADEYDLDKTDLSVSDIGFESYDNQLNAQGGRCDGYPYAFCGSMGIDDEITCNYFTKYGCEWRNATLLFNLSVRDSKCAGYLGWNSDCSNFTSEGAVVCQLTGCTWTDWTTSGSSDVSGGSFDWGAVKNTIGFLSGFRAELGVPSAFRWIFSFIFFWLPSFMLLWSIYMALPFLH